MLQTWVIHHLEIIGEAVKGLSDEYTAARPRFPGVPSRACVIDSSMEIGTSTSTPYGRRSSEIYRS